MKKLLILIILFVSVSTFAQDFLSDSLETYVRKILTEVQNTNAFLDDTEEIEKLLEEKSELEEKIQNLENNKSVKKYNNLNKVKDNIEKDLNDKEDVLFKLNKQLTDKNEKINSLNTDITELKKTITKNNKDRANEKIFIRKQIEFIIKQKSGTLSKNLLVDLRERSITYDIDPNLITKLNRYIELQNILVESTKVLNASFNSKNIKEQIDNLDILDLSSFKSLEKEMYILYNLLDDYKGKCTSLLQEFEDFDTYNQNENEIKKYLNLIEDEYKEYPYLFKKINEKKNNPDNSISIDCN